MAENVTEITDIVTEKKISSTQDMDLESLNASEEAVVDEAANGGDPNSKRAREEGAESEKEENDGAKKQRVDKSVEEQRLENLGGSEPVGGEESGRVSLGPKSFGSSVEMFNYFFKFLRFWPPNLNVNKYEHMVLLELLKKGHFEPEKKIGNGINAFQVQNHPQWKSRCFFLIRNDESVDDFSFRKCVDHILPLPENMQLKPEANKAFGGGRGGGHGGRFGGGGGGRGGFRGRGRGGKSRN
ncbi:protein EMBRYO DEFECTIVE 514 [Cornus florida]|uniref:protein EMBRYO DEFECTIVE 514 n=1 Tax=Cornus florida TaxID=4283 RepID=UPI002898C779|nr:protein EMBRYO DEFECTIVE 514 [Cornus florida]